MQIIGKRNLRSMRRGGGRGRSSRRAGGRRGRSSRRAARCGGGGRLGSRSGGSSATGNGGLSSGDGSARKTAGRGAGVEAGLGRTSLDHNGRRVGYGTGRISDLESDVGACPQSVKRKKSKAKEIKSHQQRD